LLFNIRYFQGIFQFLAGNLGSGDRGVKLALGGQ
jgi:hypothetical protein